MRLHFDFSFYYLFIYLDMGNLFLFFFKKNKNLGFFEFLPFFTLKISLVIGVKTNFENWVLSLLAFVISTQRQLQIWQFASMHFTLLCFNLDPKL